MVDILLHAHLMAGWFQKQRKGESDEDFKKRKIDVRKVASEKKNEPMHSDRSDSDSHRNYDDDLTKRKNQDDICNQSQIILVFNLSHVFFQPLTARARHN